MNREANTRLLALYNQKRLLPGNTEDRVAWEVDYLEEFLQEAQDSTLQSCDVYSLAWYERLLEDGPGQNDPLFDWLAKEATMEQMKWFLEQEAAGEAGFDDLVAMAQLKMPNRVKLEMARNYWDEVGQGSEELMHNKLLKDLVTKLGITTTVGNTVTEALDMANVMMGLACNRAYAFYAVGALGVIEMTAPGRVSRVNEGLERLGVSRKDRQYFALHAVLDIKHSRDWNREVISPLAEAGHMREIARGAHLRLWLGSRCYARYRKEFGLVVG